MLDSLYIISHYYSLSVFFKYFIDLNKSSIAGDRSLFRQTPGCVLRAIFFIPENRRTNYLDCKIPQSTRTKGIRARRSKIARRVVTRDSTDVQMDFVVI